MMALYVMNKRNGYFPPGTWVECFDQGCQKARIETVDNRLKVIGHEGILIPISELKPYMMRPMKRGLDK